MSQHRSKKHQFQADKEKDLRDEIDRLTVDVKEKHLLIAKHDKESSEWDIR